MDIRWEVGIECKSFQSLSYLWLPSIWISEHRPIGQHNSSFVCSNHYFPENGHFNSHLNGHTLANFPHTLVPFSIWTSRVWNPNKRQGFCAFVPFTVHTFILWQTILNTCSSGPVCSETECGPQPELRVSSPLRPGSCGWEFCLQSVQSDPSTSRSAAADNNHHKSADISALIPQYHKIFPHTGTPHCNRLLVSSVTSPNWLEISN